MNFLYKLVPLIILIILKLFTFNKLDNTLKMIYIYISMQLFTIYLRIVIICSYFNVKIFT